MLKVLSQTFYLSVLFFLWFPQAFGQPVLPSDLKKPKKYENRKLGAEKSAEKKFKGPRKFIQNTVTHYNWYFNANNKLAEILERAKLAHKDDFGKLLTFYNYTLERTSADKTELDSVIFKSNTGILTHDLRNAWIDNLYMLMGKAYYFRNDLDSAYMTFQYVNYAFSPREEDGYDIPIGSNATEGNNVLSVSTKEKNSLVQRALTTPPSRNESFIWQIKTYIYRDRMAEAAGLIQTINNDPLFPERLRNDLNEVQALWFYQKEIYDSSAFYLEKALGNAANRVEASRWEYLIAQLHELSGNRENAEQFYERARKRTLDPILEVYAILNSIRQNSQDSAATERNLRELRKMGRKDSYSRYRDIVYFTAAQIELERNNIPGAKAMLEKSAAASTANLNPAQRTRSFLLLGDISFNEKNYPEAKRYYDSVNNNDPGIEDPMAFDRKKDILQQIVSELNTISRQDSLQKLAAMPEAERTALLKKMVRQIRKKQGLKEEEQPGNAAVGMNDSNKPPPDLFGGSEKGDWYFNNPALKSKGFTAFRQNWGNRPNVDNWRRKAAIDQVGTGPRDPRPGMAGNFSAEGDTSSGAGVSLESLLANIPLTPVQLEVSQDSIANALLNLGIVHIDQLEEYGPAILYLEEFAEKYTYHNRMPDALYYLYLAYQKTGRNADAAKVKSDLDKKYDGTKAQQIVLNAVTGKDEKYKQTVTNDYENIYNLFIEGEFSEALERKRIADSIYGTSYWTPQLLYIESVYHLQSRNDEEARKVLNQIIDLYADQPMAEKAKTILEVLGRRKEIEDYLTQLEIKREEDTVMLVNAPPTPREQIGTPLEQDTTTLRPVNLNNIDTNTTGKKPEIIVAAPQIKVDTSRAEAPTRFTFNVESPHAVVMMLTKVDPVYVSESRNAFNRYNQERYYNQPIEISNQVLNDSVRLVVMTGFSNAAVAVEYLQKTKKVAATQIVPWLPAGKYEFITISHDNLEVMKNLQNLDEYRLFYRRYGTE